jgi:hypothetical protein
MGTCTIRIWYPTDILDLFSPLFTVAHCATLLCAQHSSSPPRVDCPIMVSTSGRVLLEVCHSLCHGRRASLPCVHISSRRAISPRLFVAFDRDMNPVLRDCVELYHPPAFVHPLEGHHALGPFVFHGAKIVSMTIEAYSTRAALTPILQALWGCLPWLSPRTPCHRSPLLLLPPTRLLT